MGVQTKIKARMEDAVVKSYYKPWRKRWWGLTLIIALVLVIAGVIYFSFLTFRSLRHIQNGEIYNSAANLWMTPEQLADSQKLAADLLSDDDPWLGAEQPLVNIVAYEDFGCPFCKENQADIKKLMGKFGSIVRFITKDFPNEGLHKGAFDAHLAAGCADDQGRYWEYHDLLYKNQGEEFTRSQLKDLAKTLGLDMLQFNDCLDTDKHNQEVRQDYASGVNLGVAGTPSYLINGSLIPGEITYDKWEQIIGFIVKGEY